MSFRVLLIENGTKVRYKLDNILVTIGDEEVSIPMSDLSTVVIDNLKSNITMRAMSMLAEKNISVVVCDMNHLPVGIFNGFNNHSRASKIIKYQMNLSKESYDLIWKEITVSKIINQAKALDLLDKQKSDEVLSFANAVQVGDSTNREAHAAKVYFNCLMGSTFSRGNDGILLNSGLNYGYTILRSFISRLCVGYGLNPLIGIHHKSEYNSFNLVDDLIEPVRPIVDLHAYHLLKDESFFSYKHRQSLINIVNHKIVYKNKKQYIGNALDEYVSSYARALKNNRFDKIEFFDVYKYKGEK